MKAGAPGPPAAAALEVLDAARALGNGGNPVVFPDSAGKPLNWKWMLRALEQLN